MRLILATANPDKAVEIGAVLVGFEVVPRPDGVPDVEETEDTLVGNASLKARAIGDATGEPAVADDTGLEVDALGGAPGLYSARYAGPGATYADNVAKLLADLDGSTDRRARFRTVAVVRFPDGTEVVAEGVVEGSILATPRGAGGFGYDSVFAPDDAGGRTFAEMTTDEKNSISHRGKAFRALAAQLSPERLRLRSHIVASQPQSSRLRSVEAGDVDDLVGIFEEPEVARWWWGYDRERIEREFLVGDDPNTTSYVIEVDGQVAGLIQSWEEPDPEYRRAGIDIGLSARWHGRGIAVEALRTLIRILITDKGHHHLTIDPAAHNGRAIACYEKVGFRPVGILRQNELGADGTFHDTLFMDLVANELDRAATVSWTEGAAVDEVEDRNIPPTSSAPSSFWVEGPPPRRGPW